MGPSGCRNSSPLPAAPQGCHPRGPAFTFAPPSLPQDPPGWRGPRWAEDQARDLSRFLGIQVVRGNLATLPFDPLSSQWFPIFPPSCVGSLPLPKPPLRGASPIPPPVLLPFHSLHTSHPTRSLGFPPVPLGVYGPPQVPGRCPSCEEMLIPCPPTTPS